MPHFLLGNRQEQIAQLAHLAALLRRICAVVERIGRVEVLHHQRVLQPRADVQQQDEVVAPLHGLRFGWEGALQRRHIHDFCVHDRPPVEAAGLVPGLGIGLHRLPQGVVWGPSQRALR